MATGGVEGGHSTAAGTVGTAWSMLGSVMCCDNGVPESTNGAKNHSAQNHTADDAAAATAAAATAAAAAIGAAASAVPTTKSKPGGKRLQPRSFQRWRPHSLRLEAAGKGGADFMPSLTPRRQLALACTRKSLPRPEASFEANESPRPFAGGSAEGVRRTFYHACLLVCA